MKLRELQQQLRAQSIQVAVFLHPDPSITYLTQCAFSYSLLLVTPQKAVLWVTKLDTKPTIPGLMVRFWSKKWKEELKRFSPKAVGIHEESCTVSFQKKLKEIWPRARFVNILPQMQVLREVKTKEEVNHIARACDVTSRAFNALVKELPQGRLKTEIDAALFLERFMRQQGCTVAFPTIVAMGKNAAVPHHVTSTAKLTRGFFLLDFGAQYRNYCADMTRVIFLGTPTAEEKKWYALLLKAQMKAIDSVRERVAFTELDAVVRKVLGRFAKNFTHSLGHGIGVEVHESPAFSDKKKIKKDMIFTIEPGIYFPGKFGLRIEDTIFFDGKKSRILTRASKELICVRWRQLASLNFHFSPQTF